MAFPAVFAILVGAGMIGQWTASFIGKQIPELKTEPIRIGFHLAAELTTALCLIIGGVGLLTGQTWSVPLYLVASGMLFYTAIVSPGYFAQKGQWGWLVMFGIIIILGIFCISIIL
ncbi:MAG: hypothetical protein PVJ21_11240 [Anaerolineales bacterium]|jgi:hypothetical protein